MTTDVLSSIKINGIRIDAVERGTGAPLLFLHPGIGLDPAAPVLDRLASHGTADRADASGLRRVRAAAVVR